MKSSLVLQFTREREKVKDISPIAITHNKKSALSGARDTAYYVISTVLKRYSVVNIGSASRLLTVTQL